MRLDYEMQVEEFYFDAAFDNIRIICKGISASPGTLAFGTEALGHTSLPLTTTVTNFASTSLQLQSLQITGPFQITSAPTLPLTLASNGTTSISVVYKASAAGAQTGTLTIHSNDPNGDTVVQLTGTGNGAPSLDAEPGALPFPDVQVGSASAPLTVTLNNDGLTNLTVTAATVPAPFQVITATPITVTPGSSAPLQVVFAPTALGFVQAQIELDSNDPASPAFVTVSGTGDPPSLGLSTTDLKFGGQRVATTSASQNVRATNTGVGPLTISAASVTGTFAEADAGLPVTLQPGDFADFGVTFTPAVEGPATGTLTLTSDIGASAITLDGTGIAPHIAVSPSPIEFGNQRLDTTGSQSVVVTNTGTDTLTVSSITTAAPYADADATPFQLAPNAQQTLTVTFTPTASGDAPGTLTLASDDANAPSLVVPTDGTGVTGLVAISPGAVQFTDQRVGTSSAPFIVTVTNAGTDTLTISSATLAGGPFTLVPMGGNVLAPGNSTQFALTFSPTVEGPASTLLSIVSDAPSSPDQVAVAGNGVAPHASVNPASLAFSPQRTGTTSATKAFTLSNPGTSTLTVSAVTATAGYVVSGITPPFTIAPGQSQPIHVAFAPTVAGADPGSVAITTDASSTPSVALSGTGIEPTISVSTTTLAFGNQRINTTSTAQTVTLTNTGTAALNISGDSAPAGYLVTPPASFPIAVLPGGKAIFTVQFAPTASGPANGNLAITSDAASSPTQVALTGTGVQALVTISPSPFDFGDVHVGQTSAAQTFTISNPGTGPYIVTNVSLGAPFVRTTALTFPTTIAPGGTLPFDVVFSPTTRTSSATTIAIATDAGFANVALTGRGVAPLIAAAPSPLAFGPVDIATISTLTLTLTNSGTSTLTVSALAIAGANAGDFTIQGGPALPATIAAGGTLPLTIAFTPGDHGVRSAQLTATSDAQNTGALVVQLTGTGQGPEVGVAPLVLDLDTSNVTVTSAAKSVTVTNSGETPLVISQIMLGGANATDFATTATLPLTIAAGSDAPVAFTFTPSAVGARAATATIVTNDTLTSSPVVVLSGTGESPTIDVKPALLAYGNVLVGNASTLPLVISNPGSGPLTISALELSGPDAAAITLAATTLPLVIDPAGSHTLQVTFTPSVVATASATLNILSDDTTTPSVAVPISGTGVSPTVSVDPSLDFGAQLVGHTSAPRKVRVQNVGTGELSVTALAITGAQGAVFTLVSPPALPATVPASGELDLSIVIAPTAIGAASADLQVTTDSPDAPDAVSHLTGLGISTAMTVTPTSLAFGTIHAGTSSPPLAVMLTNLTDDAIALGNGVLAGARPGDFSASTVAGSLAAGATITAMVTYSPATAAVSAATLTISPSDAAIPSAVIELDGTAVSAFLSVDHMAVDFGSIEVGDHSGPKSVVFTNATTASLTVASVTSSDPQFVVDDSAALAPLAPGASGSFTIAFSPTTEGSAAAGVGITLTGATTPEVTVAATGIATAKPSEGCDAGGGGGAASASALALLALVRRRRRR